MRVRRGALFTLVILAFALGAVACGKSSEKPAVTAAQLEATQAHWRAGLIQWRRSMLGALDGISLLFSTADSFAELQTPHSKAQTALHRYETTLTGCDATLGRLGAVPAAFATPGSYARQACGHLEKGEQLVEQAVAKLADPGSGTRLETDDPLAVASVPLSAGQTELGTATHALANSPTDS